MRKEAKNKIPDSLLYSIVGSNTLANVSSWHHQAVRSVEGTDLTVVAQTVDNGVTIIEGVENQNNTWACSSIPRMTASWPSTTTIPRPPCATWISA